MKFTAIGENHLYQKAYTKGAKASARTVYVYCLRDYAAARLQKANPEKKKLNRIGLTVTKKLGCAVVRNRVKRILREGYRQVDRTTPVKRGFLIVIVAKDAARESDSRRIAEDLSYALRKLGMLEGMPFPERKPGDTPSRHGDAPHGLPSGHGSDGKGLQSGAKSGEKSGVKPGEKSGEKSGVKPGEKSGAKPGEKSGERSAGGSR